MINEPTEDLLSQMAWVARAALDYIDALPDDVVASLPAMPGFDRDYADNVLHAAATGRRSYIDGE